MAGDETGPAQGLSVPIDHYNGVTIGMLRQVGGVYRQTDPSNIYTNATDGRRLMSAVAPGVGIVSTTFGNRFTRDTFTDSDADGGWDPVFNDNDMSGGGINGAENWLENFSGTGAYNNAYNAADDWYFDDNYDNVRNGRAHGDYFIAPADPRFPTPPPNSEPVQDVDANGIIDFRINGTSFAAPHVTGAAALLMEHAEDEGFTATGGQNHEVIKAVLLNSVDKRQDTTPNGFLLGMEKTIIRDGSTDSNDWITQRDAEGLGVRELHPVDVQPGTGAINLKRALTQMQDPSQGPGMVDVIGWDFSLTHGTGTFEKYVLDKGQVAGIWLSATLTWDREVTLNDNYGANDHFDAETFIDLDGDNAFAVGEPLTDFNANNTFDPANTDTLTVDGFRDLDLYLMPRGVTDISQHVARSISSLHTMEHIFFEIQDAGYYELWVHHAGDGTLGASDQQYGLAWWTVSIPEPSAAILLGGAVLLALPRRAVRR